MSSVVLSAMLSKVLLVVDSLLSSREEALVYWLYSCIWEYAFQQPLHDKEEVTWVVFPSTVRARNIIRICRWNNWNTPYITSTLLNRFDFTSSLDSLHKFLMLRSPIALWLGRSPGASSLSWEIFRLLIDLLEISSLLSTSWHWKLVFSLRQLSKHFHVFQFCLR